MDYLYLKFYRCFVPLSWLPLAVVSDDEFCDSLDLVDHPGPRTPPTPPVEASESHSLLPASPSTTQQRRTGLTSRAIPRPPIAFGKMDLRL